MIKNKLQKPVKIGLALIMSAFLAYPSFGIAQLANQNQNTNSIIGDNTNTQIIAPQILTTDLENFTTDELNKNIQEKQDQKKLIEERLQKYKEIIAEKQKTAASLNNELSLLEAQIEKTQLDTQALGFTIEEKQLQVSATQKAIDGKENDLKKQRSYLEDLVRTINRYDRQGQLEMLIAHSSFSEVINDIRATSSLQNEVSDSLNELRSVKSNLEREKNERERQKLELQGLQKDLEGTIVNLDEQKQYKGKILDETKSNEQVYSNLLEQSKQEQLNADYDIRNLQEKLKSRLGDQNTNSADQLSIFTGNRNVQLAWPISPGKGISAYFHDPTYPYRKYFEHPAIDIPINQGTAIAAVDDGYVARAKNGGFGYSYIMLVHSNSISTVYGHVSQINVAEDTYVKKGQIIGLSGGLPGTPGSGRLTTGAHLHFEVRLNGIPVNPLDYLP
ncbi:MAG: peptidoglycan DD-metalloendopeptidase family protein [Patescibacteria group bacterium]|jgi:murein DD-endopeptidase MepM/ murein hydrolase activator NlpD